MEDVNGPAGDEDEIPAATEKQKQAFQAASDEDVDMAPVRRRTKKRRVQRDSSVDEDEHMVATENQANNNEKSPSRVLQTIADDNNIASASNAKQLRLSDEPTAVTPQKPPRQVAPGKKWVKVKKTEQTMDAKGYMCF